MNLQMVGCSHQHTSLQIRERLAFSREQVSQALVQFRQEFPDAEAVLLSTCNRVELYTASDQPERHPSAREIAQFMAGFHGLSAGEISEQLRGQQGAAAVRHLFTVAASLDSMVLGEAQILSQVKEAYDLATAGQMTGPLTHRAFQAAIRVAKRIARETEIHRKRVSIPSVAVGDFVGRIYESLDDKWVLLIGAGEMAQETVRCLQAEGTPRIVIVNRDPARAQALALRYAGEARRWEELDEWLQKVDLVVSTTGASAPLVTIDRFRAAQRQRHQRPLTILDLAVPRDFDPAIGDLVGVYLYSLDDLAQACQANQDARRKEWPRAQRIIEEEVELFWGQLAQRHTGTTIRQLRDQADALKLQELSRLRNKLPGLEPRAQREIERAFDRLVSKLLHSPCESLRDEAGHGVPYGLLHAVRRLFRLED